jgi:hypothetical protein
MEATAYPTTTTPRNLAAHIQHWRDTVLDLDILVDDTRHDVDRAVDAFRAAVQERQRAAVHLAHLLELAATADRYS